MEGVNCEKCPIQPKCNSLLKIYEAATGCPLCGCPLAFVMEDVLQEAAILEIGLVKWAAASSGRMSCL